MQPELYCTDASRQGDADAMQLFRDYVSGRDRRLRNRLVEEHRWMAHVAARRFANRGEPVDDLRQVAMLGLLQAIERFDPEFGSSFAAFALPSISGELRRHFRDKTWALRVSRRAKELHLKVVAAVEPLTHDLGRPPRLSELARHVGGTVEDVVEAMEAGNAYRTAPLSGRPNDDGVSRDGEALAFDDEGLAGADDRVALRIVLGRLPERERQIIFLRFFDDLTQSEIARKVGISQVHVSRLLRSTLEQLGDELEPSHELVRSRRRGEPVAVAAAV